MESAFTSASRWIACPEELSAPIVLKKVTLAPGEKGGEICITGLGYYELFVNGSRVGEDYFKPAVSDYSHRDFSKMHYPLPGEETSHRIYYNIYDLSSYLREGENTLAVMLGNGFYRQTRRVGEGQTKFGDRLICRFELTVGDRKIVSDGTEDCILGFITENNLFYGEIHDYALLDGATQIYPVAVTELNSPLCLQEVPCDRIRRTLTPKMLRQSDGKTLYDVGENITGFVEFTPLSHDVSILHTEKLDDDGNLRVEDKQPSENRYRNAAERTVKPWFNWSGFRYFEITGEVKDVTVYEVHTDISPIATFECGNETLNWLFNTYLHTQLVNMHGGVPSDCPHRERLGYTGDGQLTCESAMLTLDARKFYEKWISDIADCQDIHSGHVQHTAPFFGGGGGPGGWGGAMVIVPYTFYRVYGDPSLLETYYSNMTAFLDCMETFCEDGLVVKERKDGWCLGDWCTPGDVLLPEPFVNTYYYIRCMEMMGEIAALLGKPEDYSSRISDCKAALDRAYFDPATHDYCSGVQGANAFALSIGLGDTQTRKNFISRYTADPRPDTGIFGTDVLTGYLAKTGEIDLLYKILTAKGCPSFDYMKEQGATTLWEYWEGKYSHNHPMFGGCVKQLFYGLCGISGDAGFKNITLNPKYIEGIGYIKASLKLPMGKLSLHLTYENGKVSVSCESTGTVNVTVIEANQ